jgi:hypothetical protein
MFLRTFDRREPKIHQAIFKVGGNGLPRGHTF